MTKDEKDLKLLLETISTNWESYQYVMKNTIDRISALEQEVQSLRFQLKLITDQRVMN